jgi:hypothetical protein
MVSGFFTLKVVKHGEYISYLKSGEVIYKWYYINNDMVTESEWLSYNRDIKLESIL